MKQLTAGAAFAATLLWIAPAQATAATSAQLAPAVSVERFVAGRRHAPLWLADPAATGLLIERLRSAELDGFARGPALADAAQTAFARARNGDRSAGREAERLLTSSWILYVQALRWPAGGVEFADPALAPVLPSPEQVLEQLSKIGRAHV